MAYPTYLTARSIPGAATPSYLNAPLASGYVNGQTITIANTAGWYEVSSSGTATTNPLGTSGIFTLVIDYNLATEEKILCAPGAITIGQNSVITIWTDGVYNGRGWDGTPVTAHSIGSSSVINVFPVRTAVDDLQYNAASVTLTNNLATLSGQYVTTSGILTTTTGNVSALSSSLTTLSGQYVVTSGSLTTLSGQYLTTSGIVTTATGNIATLTSNLSTLSGQYVVTSGSLTTLSGQYLTTSGIVTTATGNIASLTASLNTVSGVAYAALPATGGTITGNLVVASGFTVSGTSMHIGNATFSGTVTATGIQITESQVTNLTTDLSNRALTTTIVTGTVGQITGGGTLASNQTLGLATAGPGSGALGTTAAQTPNITVDAYGRVISVANNSIAIAESQVTNLTTDLSNRALTTTVVTGTANQITGGGTLASNQTFALSNTLVVPGSVTVPSGLTVSGITTINNNLTVGSGLTVSGALSVASEVDSGAMTIGGNLTVTGTSTQIGNATFSGTVTSNAFLPNVTSLTVATNAVTVTPSSYTSTKITNNAAATVAITLSTTGATDGMQCIVRFYDYAVTQTAQTLTWVNTENSQVSVPGTSNGSSTLPLTVGFIYNGSTSKWRCVAVA